MKKKTFKYLILITFIVISLFAVIRIFRLDRLGFNNVKWGDYIKYNGITYEGQYTEENDRISITESLIEKKIGEIIYQLQGNVRNTFYKMRNNDATILEQKTELYKIHNEDTKVSIAVKIGSNYYQYSSNEIK